MLLIVACGAEAQPEPSAFGQGSIPGLRLALTAPVEADSGTLERCLSVLVYAANRHRHNDSQISRAQSTRPFVPLNDLAELLADECVDVADEDFLTELLN